MFLSKLVLDPAHPQARRDLANPYEMHRTLSRVYAESPDGPPARFLWRLEHTGNHLPEDGTTILLQSATPGRWRCLQELTGYLHALYPDKAVALDELLQPGRSYVFRLCCNPTVTRNGKRYGLLREGEQVAWLARQGRQHGFTPLHARIARSEHATHHQGRGSQRITLQVVQFDGLLRAEDPAQLGQALVNGIGHAKAMGQGMLSIAPGHG